MMPFSPILYKGAEGQVISAFFFFEGRCKSRAWVMGAIG